VVTIGAGPLSMALHALPLSGYFCADCSSEMTWPKGACCRRMKLQAAAAATACNAKSPHTTQALMGERVRESVVTTTQGKQWPVTMPWTSRAQA
jgi:hypothetical protein